MYNYYTIVSHNLIKDKLEDLIENISKGKTLFILHVITGVLSSNLMQSEVNRKAVTWNKYDHIPHPTVNTRRKKDTHTI